LAGRDVGTAPRQSPEVLKSIHKITPGALKKLDFINIAPTLRWLWLMNTKRKCKRNVAGQT
jgi:hypothetical protein